MTFGVFLVEDEPQVQDSLKVVIEGFLRAEVIGAVQTEAEAVTWLQAHEGGWHLLVVDLLLAQRSGLGVLASLAHCPQKGTVVALTNAASQDNREECLRLGADAVFDKAAEVNEFLTYCAARAEDHSG